MNWKYGIADALYCAGDAAMRHGMTAKGDEEAADAMALGMLLIEASFALEDEIFEEAEMQGVA